MVRHTLVPDTLEYPHRQISKFTKLQKSLLPYAPCCFHSHPIGPDSQKQPRSGYLVSWFPSFSNEICPTESPILPGPSDSQRMSHICPGISATTFQSSFTHPFPPLIDRREHGPTPIKVPTKTNIQNRVGGIQHTNLD